MPSSYVCQLVHFVWSTFERRASIGAEWKDRLYGYVGGIARNKGATLLCAGGMPDHVHLLVSVSSSTSLAEMVNLLKSNSSHWIHENIAGAESFHWQTGYAAFSVSRSGVNAVRQYIATQAAHHARQSFQDEFRALLCQTRDSVR